MFYELKNKIMKTHLEDEENNIRIKQDNGKILLSDIIDSIEFRIIQHKKFIKRDEEEILRHVDCVEIVSKVVERINERKAKIGELREFIKYCL